MIDLEKTNLVINEQRILNELSLTVSAGECVVLTGASGSGKTSLINLLAGLIPELYSGKISGTAVSCGHTLPPLNFYEYVKTFGIVFQNPKTQFFMSDVLSELAFPMENFGLTCEAMQQRIAQQTKKLGLEVFIHRQMQALSGGEKQLIAFASSSMLPHQLFLLDEPSSNLDSATKEKILSALITLKEQGHTIIIAEHRLDYLMPLADRIVLLNNGAIETIYPQAHFSQFSNQALHELGLRGIHPPASSTQKKCREQPTSSLSLADITFSYQKNGPLQLNIAKLVLDNSQIIGLTGANGAGKTTLSKILTGFLKPKTGKLFFNGTPILAKQLIAKSFLVMQDVNLQLFFETVEKELTLTPVKKDFFDKVTTKLKLKPLLQRHPQTLSGGEKQRVAIASALLSGKELIIFDEPTSGLDYQQMLAFSQTLQWLNQLEVIVIVISHDQEFLNCACTQILTLTDGTILTQD